MLFKGQETLNGLFLMRDEQPWGPGRQGKEGGRAAGWAPGASALRVAWDGAGLGGSGQGTGTGERSCGQGTGADAAAEQAGGCQARRGEAAAGRGRQRRG